MSDLITQQEMIDLFGASMPIEAVHILETRDQPIEEIRRRLRELASPAKAQSEVERPDIAALVERLRRDATLGEGDGSLELETVVLERAAADAITALQADVERLERELKEAGDHYENLLNAAERRVEELREVAKVSLCVLSLARNGQSWHENMLKDFDLAIEGCRRAAYKGEGNG